MNRSAWGWAFFICWNSILFFYSEIQPSCRGLQRHSWTNQQPHPHREPVQHQGQRQWSLYLQVRTAGVRRYAAQISWSYSCAPCRNLSLLITRLVKNAHPPTCKCPEVHFIFPLNQYKVTTDSQLYIWVLHFTSLSSINSDFFLELCGASFSAGWWFEACGPSNLNGKYYPAASSVVRYNGIKWYYWKGPNLMATMTTMMVRPANFWWHKSSLVSDYIVKKQTISRKKCIF